MQSSHSAKRCLWHVKAVLSRRAMGILFSTCRLILSLRPILSFLDARQEPCVSQASHSPAPVSHVIVQPALLCVLNLCCCSAFVSFALLSQRGNPFVAVSCRVLHHNFPANYARQITLNQAACSVRPPPVSRSCRGCSHC